MSFKFNLYQERDKKDKLHFGVIKLHQLELFGLVNRTEILFRESNKQNDFLE
jgi:hypothetical protein